MSLGRPSQAVFLQPPTATSAPFANRPSPVTSVTVHPIALFSILDHYLRRDEKQDRVIGTLLGSRQDGEVEVKSAFAVLHAETAERVAVDMDYHRTMLELHQRINPREVIVGWYSTGGNLNNNSALIQGFYQHETAPHPAIHLSLDTDATDGQLGVKTYLSAPVGVTPKLENCVFTPVPCTLRYTNVEKGGLDLLSNAASSSTHLAHPEREMEELEKAVTDVVGMLDRVLSYVQAVLKGERKGDPAVGRYLLDTLSAEGPALGRKGAEALIGSQLQDTIMVSYLASLVRSQVEVSSRLALVT
ncbi:Mov34-domain-containing protein [Calocera cornea HHB12733]|uniref:Eukaryotic translation initiation factor 3 subunit F n=1 Tax=Calocera cornea HHB12733 TaxID=1353952 RepID=A0A165IKU8_9BASI|nr:Mov34-domain-containing protein [Calocera cornea HHB12733]